MQDDIIGENNKTTDFPNDGWKAFAARGRGRGINTIDTIHIDTLGGFLLGGDFRSGSLLEESSCNVFVSVACPFNDSLFADLRLLFAVTLLLFILFTAMLPILCMELTALGKQVVVVLPETFEVSRSLLFNGCEGAWEIFMGKVTHDPLPTTPVVSSVPSSPECLCSQAFFNL